MPPRTYDAPTATINARPSTAAARWSARVALCSFPKGNWIVSHPFGRAGTIQSTEELADRVHSLAVHLLRQIRARDAESGLTAARLSALSTLVRKGPLSVGELAAAEQVTAPTMNRLVTALEREAYVSREPDAADGRRIQVVAMEAGIRALVEARRRRVERLASLLDALPAEGLEAVVDATSLLESVLEEDAG